MCTSHESFNVNIVEEKNMEHDVVVVGGGPAGVIAAITLAKNDKSVALLDMKHQEDIGDKTCGDALDKAAPQKLKEKLNLAMPTRNEISDVVEYIIIEGPSEESVLEIPAEGYVMNRHVYGQRLLKEAMNLGVDVYSRHKVIGPIIKDGFVKGVKAINLNTRSELEFNSKIVIDASGSSVAVRGKLPKDGFPLIEKEVKKQHVTIAYREIVKLKEDHSYKGKIIVKYDPDIPSPGYFWIFSKGKKMLNLGTGFIKAGPLENLSIKKVYFEAREKYYPGEKIEKVISSKGHPVPTRFPLMNAVENGLICAGDSAFHADPLLAEGHGPALRAGYYAGITAAEAINNNDFSARKLWKYNHMVLEDFGFKWSSYQIATVTLKTIGPKGVDLILRRRIISTGDFSKLVEGKGIGLFDKIWRLIKLFPRYDILLEGYSALKGFEKLNKLHERYPDDPRNYLKWFEEYRKVICSYMKKFSPC